jgi:hypothetical protein
MKILWEEIESLKGSFCSGDKANPDAKSWWISARLGRTKVPGGWLVLWEASGSMTFYPDPEHKWDGNSLP